MLAACHAPRHGLSTGLLRLHGDERHEYSGHPCPTRMHGRQVPILGWERERHGVTLDSAKRIIALVAHNRGRGISDDKTSAVLVHPA